MERRIWHDSIYSYLTFDQSHTCGIYQEEIAEARRKRKLNILFLGMTRVAEYDSRGGLTKGMKRFDLVERMVRGDVDETNMNPLRCVLVFFCRFGFSFNMPIGFSGQHRDVYGFVSVRDTCLSTGRPCEGG